MGISIVFIFCKLSAPTIEYVTHLFMFHLNESTLKAKMLCFPISQVEAKRVRCLGENVAVPGEILESSSRFLEPAMLVDGVC